MFGYNSFSYFLFHGLSKRYVWIPAVARSIAYSRLSSIMMYIPCCLQSCDLLTSSLEKWFANSIPSHSHRKCCLSRWIVKSLISLFLAVTMIIFHHSCFNFSSHSFAHFTGDISSLLCASSRNDLKYFIHSSFVIQNLSISRK